MTGENVCTKQETFQVAVKVIEREKLPEFSLVDLNKTTHRCKPSNPTSSAPTLGAGLYHQSAVDIKSR